MQEHSLTVLCTITVTLKKKLFFLYICDTLRKMSYCSVRPHEGDDEDMLSSF